MLELWNRGPKGIFSRVSGTQEGRENREGFLELGKQQLPPSGTEGLSTGEGIEKAERKCHKEDHTALIKGIGNERIRKNGHATKADILPGRQYVVVIIG